MAKKQDSLADLFVLYKENVTHYPAILRQLTEELGVTAASLQALEIGFNPDYQSWIFPERDNKGNIIGLMQRLPNGKKLMIKGSKRGLIYAVNYERQKYTPGKHNWQRVSKDIPCPLCGKSDGCLVPTGNPSNPSAIICVHISEGATKALELGYLHILKPEGKLRCGQGGILHSSNQPVIVVEGASDTAAAMDLGFVVVGRPSAEGGLSLLSLLIRGRRVIVVGDNDAGAGQKGMEAAFRELKLLCKSVVKLLPPEGIKDLRDWKNNHGLTQESFLEYVKVNGQTTENADVFEDDVGHTIANKWLKQEKTKDGCLILRNYRGQWVEHMGRCYENLETEYFRGQLYKFLDGKQFCHVNPKGETVVLPYKPTRSKVGDIIDALNQWCPIRQDPPIWLAKNDLPDPVHLIVFQNGILDVQKYMRGEICLYDNTPELFTYDVLPYNFNEDLESIIWKDFLEDIYNGDKDKIQLLSQWFGYNCVPDMSYEKLMLFTGRPRSGKSTVLETMQAMLGDRQCCETSFQGLAGAFGYQPLLGKYAAILGDAKTPKSGEASAALEKILHVTGGDAVSVNRKGIRELPIVHLKCRFTIAMNDLPSFTDHARALEPRLNIITFDNSYVGKEDRTLKFRLRKEAQQGKLINFALRGLKDLYERKDFIVPKSSAETLIDFQRLASPVVTFIAECCEVDPDRDNLGPGNYFIVKDQLYEVWSSWCNNQGRKPGVKEQFGRWFLAACPRAITTRRRIGDRRMYVFEGVKLQDWVIKDFLGK